MKEPMIYYRMNLTFYTFITTILLGSYFLLNNLEPEDTPQSAISLPPAPLSLPDEPQEPGTWLGPDAQIREVPESPDTSPQSNNSESVQETTKQVVVSGKTEELVTPRVSAPAPPRHYTPPHDMAKHDYPFDEEGNYRKEWVKESGFSTSAPRSSRKRKA